MQDELLDGHSWTSLEDPLSLRLLSPSCLLCSTLLAVYRFMITARVPSVALAHPTPICQFYSL